MAEYVAGTVDARPLPVPDAEHPIELALAAQFGLLRAPQRGGGEVLVEAGLKHDIVGLEHALGALELIVEPAQRRAAIPGDVARGIEPGATITLLLDQAHPHQCLIAGDEDAVLGEIVLVGEGDFFERHRSGLRGITKCVVLLYSGRSEWSEGPWFGCPRCDFVPYPQVATKLPQRRAARNFSYRGAKKALCVQHLGNLAPELVKRERRGDEADAGLDGPVMHDRVAGIAGGEQNLDLRAALPHLVR